MSRHERLTIPDAELSQPALTLAQRFVQRWDLYARQLADGRYMCVHEMLGVDHLFAHLRGELTLGRFEALRVDFGEDGTARLLAVRDRGEGVPVEGLSEGTADQLYLALRIATIEEHASRTEPLPLVCDDVFVSFDDARTGAGLRVLAELGTTTQTILFTHHTRVVELAREYLADRVQLIDLAERQSP